jgi:hypothetical protein
VGGEFHEPGEINNGVESPPSPPGQAPLSTVWLTEAFALRNLLINHLTVAMAAFDIPTSFELG